MRKYYLLIILIYFNSTFSIAQSFLSNKDKMLFEDAKNFFNEEKFSQAVTRCSDIIKNGARAGEVYKLRADAYRFIGEYEKASLDYNEALQLNKKDIFLYVDKAMALMCQKKFEEAEAAITEAVLEFKDKGKENTFALVQRGRIYHYLGNYKQAIEDFTTALQLGDNMAKIDILSSLFRNRDMYELKTHTEKLLQEERKEYGLLSDSMILNYVKTLNEITTSNQDQKALYNIDKALSFYKNINNRCYQGFYFDLLYTKAHIQFSMGKDSASYDLFKKIAAANTHQEDIKYKLDELKEKLGIDIVPPSLTILRPLFDENNSVTVTPIDGNIELYGKVSDSSGVASIKLNNNTVNKIEDDGVFMYSLDLLEGRNEIIISVIDKNDNKTEKKLIINKPAETEIDASYLSEIPDLEKSQAKFHAILIAENDYEDEVFADLQRPMSDALELKDILVKNYEFEDSNVLILNNAKRLEILEAIQRKTDSLKEDDNLFIFYAGHGDVKKSGNTITGGYLIPSDAKKGNTFTYISAENLKETFRDKLVRHIFFVVDACFGGALFRSIDNAPRYVRKQYVNPSRKILSSGNLEEVPDQGEFIKNFKHYLKAFDGKYLLTSELATFVKQHTEQTAPRYEQIDGTGSLGGEFIFIKRSQK